MEHDSDSDPDNQKRHRSQLIEATMGAMVFVEIGDLIEYGCSYS